MARESLTARIALEGGDQVKKELDTIANNGVKAFKALAAAAKNAKLDSGLAGSLQRIRLGLLQLRAAGSAVAENFAPLGRSFSALGDSVGTVTRRVGALGAAATAAGVGIFALAKASADAADAAGRQAQSLGLTIREYGRLSFAAQQADVDAGGFATAMTALNRLLGRLPLEDAADAVDGAARSIGDATESVRGFNETTNAAGVTVRTLAKGAEAFHGTVEKAAKVTTDAGDVFKRLGIAIRDSNGALLPTETILANIADAFAKMPDGPQKAAAALQLFGRSGADLIPLLNEGSAGIRALGDDAERLGVVFTDAQAKMGDAFGDALGRFGAAITGIRNTIGQIFQEPLTPGINAVADALADNRAAIQQFVSDLTQRAIPIIHDFFAVLSGRDEAVQNPEILKIRDAVVQFANDVRGAWENIIRPALEGIGAAFDFVAKTVNSLFGTDFTGRQLAIATVIGAVSGAFGVLAATIGVATAAIGAIIGTITTLVTLFGGIPVAIGAIVAGLAALVVFNWGDIVARVQQMFDHLVSSFDQLVVQPIRAGFQALLDFIAGLFGAASFATLWSGLTVAADAAWESITTRAQDALAGLVAAVVDVAGEIADALADPTEALAELWDGAVEGVLDALGDLKDGALDILEDIVDAAVRAARAIARAFRAADDAPSGSSGGSAPGLASGGAVRGPGTSRSDSILARLSNGEFVMQVPAVRKYGVAFMRAVNAGRLSLSAAMQALGGVDLSGLSAGVRSVGRVGVPSFASGGLVDIGAALGSGRPFQLVLPGGEVVAGMTATDDAIVQLSRYAMRRQLLSGGPKPSWYGS